MAREILSKRNFFDFESPDSAISRFPMTLMKSMASLHQGPKVSNAVIIFLENMNHNLNPPPPGGTAIIIIIIFSINFLFMTNYDYYYTRT
jgi:hypothetical protein